MINRKGGVFFQYISAVLLFSLVIVGFYVIPNQTGGFWEAYKYTPEEDLSGYDKSSQLDSTITNVACDTGLEDCQGEDKNFFAKTGDFINAMVNGAYGGLVTIYKSFGVTRTLVMDTGTGIGVPREITDIMITMILALIVITVVLIIFNRSDTV